MAVSIVRFAVSVAAAPSDWGARLRWTMSGGASRSREGPAFTLVKAAQLTPLLTVLVYQPTGRIE